jgi:hypothetical protein
MESKYNRHDDSAPDYRWAKQDEWHVAWDALRGEVGRDFEEGVARVAADPIEASTVRRFLEPLEFDCPLHYDADAARTHGYRNILAPYSGLATWYSEGLWQPGRPPLWVDPSRNAQPSGHRTSFPKPAPDTDSVFQTDLDHVFVRPLVVGDRLTTVGMRLLACDPKETRVGRGAFITWEVVVLDELRDPVAITRPTAYWYVARSRAPGGG